MTMSVSPRYNVEYEELEGSPRVRIRQSGVQAVRMFRVPEWDRWRDFAKELIGEYGALGVVPSFQLPIPFPGFSNLLVTDLDVDPMFDESSYGDAAATLDTVMNRYKSGAKITAVYATNFDNSGGSGNEPTRPDGTTLSISGDLGYEMLSTSGRAWKWSTVPGNPQVDPDQFPGIVLPTGDVVMNWGRVPLPPWEAIRALRGTVNDSTFFGSPAGTLMFFGARYRRMFQFLENDALWEFEYTFRENKKTRGDGTTVGWNYFFREIVGSSEHWHAIEDGSGNPPFGSGDFNRLFQFPTVSP